LVDFATFASTLFTVSSPFGVAGFDVSDDLPLRRLVGVAGLPTLSFFASGSSGVSAAGGGNASDLECLPRLFVVFGGLGGADSSATSAAGACLLLLAGAAGASFSSAVDPLLGAAAFTTAAASSLASDAEEPLPFLPPAAGNCSSLVDDADAELLPRFLGAAVNVTKTCFLRHRFGSKIS
jgi:hypothetical protein